MATPFSTPNEPSSLQGFSYHHGADKTTIDNNVDICGNTNTDTLYLPVIGDVSNYLTSLHSSIDDKQDELSSSNKVSHSFVDFNVGSIVTVTDDLILQGELYHGGSHITNEKLFTGYSESVSSTGSWGSDAYLNTLQTGKYVGANIWSNAGGDHAGAVQVSVAGLYRIKVLATIEPTTITPLTWRRANFGVYVSINNDTSNWRSNSNGRWSAGYVRTANLQLDDIYELSEDDNIRIKTKVDSDEGNGGIDYADTFSTTYTNVWTQLIVERLSDEDITVSDKTW